MGKNYSPPPAPDYGALAAAQGAANVDVARLNSRLNNPAVVRTPWGTQTTRFPDNGDRAVITQRLAPGQQQLFNQNQRINQRLGGLAETGVGFVNNMLSRPFNQGALPGLTPGPVRPGMTAQGAIMQRLQPQINQQRTSLEQSLANRGVARDSDPWRAAFAQQNQRENDLMSQAAAQGIGLDTQARQNSLGERQAAIQEQSFFRNEPLNILNAVRSGVQIGNPQFQPYQGGANAQAAPIFQAGVMGHQNALNNYNAGQASQGNFLSGLMGLGGSLGSAWLMSDRRLKTDIEKLGTHPEGFGIYSFRYLDSDDKQIGYMADEVEQVMPWAVREIDGFKAVNYGAI